MVTSLQLSDLQGYQDLETGYLEVELVVVNYRVQMEGFHRRQITMVQEQEERVWEKIKKRTRTR
jgi:hypothetical protein